MDKGQVKADKEGLGLVRFLLVDEKGKVRFKREIIVEVHASELDHYIEFLGAVKNKQAYKSWGGIARGSYFLHFFYRPHFNKSLVATWPVVEEISFSPKSQTLNFPMDINQAATHVQPLVLTVKFKDGTEKKVIARTYLGHTAAFGEMLKNDPWAKDIKYSGSGSKGVHLGGKKGLHPRHCLPGGYGKYANIYKKGHYVASLIML